MANTYLNPNELYPLAASGNTVYGSTGNEVVTLLAGSFGSTFDQNVERLVLSGNSGAYTFKQTGNVLNVFSGATLVFKTPMQGDSNGTQVTFSDGTVDFRLVAGVMTFTLPGVASTSTYTLKEAYEVTTTPAKTEYGVLYWGYNPHLHNDSSSVNGGATGVDNQAGGNTNNLTNEGPTDGGVPASEMVGFFESLLGLPATGTDFKGVFLALLDALKTPGSSLAIATGAIVSNNTSTGTGGSVTLTVNNAGGGIAAQAQVVLAEKSLQLLHDALFDQEGNSRLYLKDVVTPAKVNEPSLTPIKLTTALNNGGTVETDVVTGAGNDLIVAGRLDLLHQAYIDAGAGTNNILEVEAKGTYAQPLLLKNIQEVRVHDLPNFYTSGTGGYLGDSSYPKVTNTGIDDSWLDLSRAVDINKLVITDGGTKLMSQPNQLP